MTRLYREAGQRILETDFVTTIGDPQLSEAAEPYRQRVHEISEVDDDLERLEAEGEQLASEMESLVPSGKVRNRIDEMDEELDIIEAQRADLRMRVSVSVEERLEHPPADAEGNLQTQDLPAELSELLDSIRSKAGEIAQRDTLVQRLQAGIDAEQINGEIAQLDANISRKETQLERMKEEIESLQKHRQELESRMKAKQKERGSLKDLKPEAAK